MADASPDPFAAYTSTYTEVIDRSVSIFGERGEYFARHRVSWLSKRLHSLHVHPNVIVDFGCGVGGAIPFLSALLKPQELIGTDISLSSLQEAGRRHGAPAIRFVSDEDVSLENSADLIFCNGVLHHVEPAGLPSVAGSLFAKLRPGGILALWENNPWNPGTRWAMRFNPFDAGVRPLSARTVRRLLRTAGLRILRTDYCFFFPHMLRSLRIFEPFLAWCPFGAQYLILADRVSSPIERLHEPQHTEKKYGENDLAAQHQ